MAPPGEDKIGVYVIRPGHHRNRRSLHRCRGYDSRFSASGQTFRRTLFIVSTISLVDTMPAIPTLNGREPAVKRDRPTRRPSA